MPAASSSSTSCQRFSLREPGTLVCASSSTRATCGSAGQDRVDVHLGERGAAVGDLAPRHDLQAVEQVGGVLAAVGLDEPDDDVGAALGSAVALAEHGVGLADARRRAEVDPQLPATHGTSSPSSWPSARSCGAQCVCPRGLACRRSLGRERVQGEVELEDVDARLAEEPERASLGVLVDQRPDLRLAQAAFPGDAGDLLAGVGGADVRVEAGPAGQQGVRGTCAGCDAVERRAAVARRSLMAAMRSLFSGPRLDAEVDSGSYPRPAAEGRLWKYAGSGSTTGLPSASFFGLPFSRTDG